MRDLSEIVRDNKNTFEDTIVNLQYNGKYVVVRYAGLNIVDVKGHDTQEQALYDVQTIEREGCDFAEIRFPK